MNIERTGPTIVERTQVELVAEMTRRFGDDHRLWSFVCPNCGDVASAQDFKDAGVEEPFSRLGQECIGRQLGALSREFGYATGKYQGRGCDWVAYGLFGGPEYIVMPDGRKVGSFAIAPKPKAKRKSRAKLPKPENELNV